MKNPTWMLKIRDPISFSHAIQWKTRNLKLCRKISQVLGSFFCDGAIKKLRKDSAKCRNIEDYIDLAFSFSFGTIFIKPVQVKWEISRLMKILRRLSPKTILEIGTANGGSFYLFTKVASPRATLISIDLPGPGRPFGIGYPKWKVPFYQSFKSADQEIHLLRADSHNETTLSEVRRILKGRKLDFLFIEGDHTYEGVRQDFEIYRPFISKEGMIAFHDICLSRPETNIEVNRFWGQIKNDYQYKEIVKDWNQAGGGIGFIYI